MEPIGFIQLVYIYIVYIVYMVHLMFLAIMILYNHDSIHATNVVEKISPKLQNLTLKLHKMSIQMLNKVSASFLKYFHALSNNTVFKSFFSPKGAILSFTFATIQIMQYISSSLNFIAYD